MKSKISLLYMSFLGIIVLTVISLSSLYSYLLFHTIAEFISIVIAMSIFLIAWNTYNYNDNHYFLFLGYAYFFIAAIDMIHTMSYTGMPIFKGYTTNLTSSLWIFARYMESISIFSAFFFLKRKINRNLLIIIYFIISISGLFLIFSKRFPVCHIEGHGITAFKFTSEYIISSILIVSGFLLFKLKRFFDKRLFLFMLLSIITTIISEMCFTYPDPYGFANLMGHNAKILSFYFIYKGIIETGLKRPYSFIFKNLSDREQNLRMSEGELKKNQINLFYTLNSIINSDYSLIYSIDKEYRYTSFNRGHASIMKSIYGAEIEIGHNILDFITVFADKEKTKYNLDLALSGKEIIEETYSGEDRLSRKYFTISYCPIKTAIRDIIGVAVIARDMTERRIAEEALQKSEALLNATQKLSKIGGWEYDIQTGKSYWTDELYHIHEIIKTPDLDHSAVGLESYRLEDRPVILSAFKKACDCGDQYDLELPFTTQKGNHLWIRTTAQPIYEDGKIVRLIGNLMDITERKKSENELKLAEAKHFELERKLIQSQKLESLGTLASGIAHDFNNILAIILGYSSLTEHSMNQSTELNKCFEAISKAAHRGELLVKQLLTFARKSETLFKPTDINILITEISTLLNETFPKTIHISTNLQKNIPLIIADAAQLHQVLMNLCINARDAMPQGGYLTITSLVIENTADISKFGKIIANQYVEIIVADSGIGMDEKTKLKVFDPFFTTKEPGKGTGLGLAIVYSIIDNHHGIIDIETETGKGTSFHLYLPIVEHSINAEKTMKNIHTDTPNGTETILLIEDEDLIFELVETILIKKGYTVLSARDGEKGVEMFTRHQKEIAAVLSDIGLPKLRGDEVVKRIKLINPNTKIILLSGFLDPEIKMEMVKIGVNDFIQKPFIGAEVIRCLRSVIDAEENRNSG